MTRASHTSCRAFASSSTFFFVCFYRYVDDDNNATVEYPYNPNGSPEGIAALCSPDGRHLAMMPHPERCFLKWQVRR